LNEELRLLMAKPVATIPEVGRIVFGLLPRASYYAADRGEIPTVRTGKKRFVPTAKLRSLLGMESEVA
jgi:hypothetical protein